MKGKSWENSIPPQEMTPPAEEEGGFAYAENIETYQDTEPSFEAPQKAIDIMAEAEMMSGASEKELFPEKKELMESAREGRLGILGNAFTRAADTIKSAKEKAGEIKDSLPEPAQELMSQIMDVSSVKMYTEAVRGKTLTGKELSPKDRVLSAMIAGTHDISRGLFLYAANSGNPDYAKLGSIAYGASWALLMAKNGPKMLHNLKELASYYHLNDAGLVLARAGSAFDRHGYANLPQVF